MSLSLYCSLGWHITVWTGFAAANLSVWEAAIFPVSDTLKSQDSEHIKLMNEETFPPKVDWFSSKFWKFLPQMWKFLPYGHFSGITLSLLLTGALNTNPIGVPEKYGRSLTISSQLHLFMQQASTLKVMSLIKLWICPTKGAIIWHWIFHVELKLGTALLDYKFDFSSCMGHFILKWATFSLPCNFYWLRRITVSWYDLGLSFKC